MARTQIPLFATKDDLSSLLRAVEQERQLHYVVGGMFDEQPEVHTEGSAFAADDGALSSRKSTPRAGA